MKLSTTKHGWKALLAGFFLFGLMALTATSAGAQDIYNWKQSDTAKDLLVNEVRNLQGQIPGLSGNPLNDAKAKEYYYKEIIHRLGAGAAVGDAVANSLSIYNTPNPQLADKFTDVTVDASLRTVLLADATNLLKQ